LDRCRSSWSIENLSCPKAASALSLFTMTIRKLDSDIGVLERKRERLRGDIGRQQRLLAALKEHTATAQRDQASAAVADFERQVEELEAWSPWMAASRSGAIRKLRERAHQGERIDDLKSLVKAAAIERR
jgi:hypothetical protein